LTKSSSLRIEVLSFQRPGPGGTTSGTSTDNKTPQWSEKGHGTKEQDETDDTQTYGTPIRSIREARLPLHLVQVKPEAEGCRYLQISITQHASKRLTREEELSREESKGSEPDWSKERSKTALKSPTRTVGIEGSTLA